MEVLDIGLERPDILPPNILMRMVFLMVKLFEYLLAMEDVDIGLLRSSTLTLNFL